MCNEFFPVNEILPAQSAQCVQALIYKDFFKKEVFNLGTSQRPEAPILAHGELETTIELFEQYEKVKLSELWSIAKTA
ncbi:hypothetical protein [Methylobacter sp. BlB1]|uniref:hypothetical protein n=1 Tax=Methylobacter sp. BlB1 TaxID=2785914 RepID=UPI00189365C2|nr:hypothetical protein [Methylobacter sp. BlB1]MBF6649525.1 hypothetical protein [Methylobacter sp. BlB1]